MNKNHVKKIKKLASMKRDLDTRLCERNLKALGSSNNWVYMINGKIEKFIMEIDIVDEEFKSELSESDMKNAGGKIEEMRQAANYFKELIEDKIDLGKVNKEDEMIGYAQFIKNIANEMLEELLAQNKQLENKLKSVENSKYLLEKSQGNKGCFERCADRISNWSLISTMIILALVILLISVLL